MAQEEAIPFDSKKTIYKVTPEIENKLKFFRTDAHFVDAELFKSNDTLYILETHYKKDEKLYRERAQIPILTVNVLRYKLDSINAVSKVETLDLNEGRGFLLGACLVSGLTTYGPAFIGIVNSNNSRTNTGLYMLGAGGLFFIPYFATKDIPVSYGQANLVYYGLSRGFIHGMLLDFCITDSRQTKFQNVAAAGVLMGLTESTVGFNLVKKMHLSNGNANLITVYGDYGLFLGISAAVQLSDFANVDSKLLAGLSVVGALGSEYFGYNIGKKYTVSTGDAEIIYSTGLLGAFLPLSFVNAANPSKASSYTTPSILMGIAGIYVGHKLTQKVDYTFTQGFITKLGTIAGGLMGCGLTYLTVNNAKSWQYLAGSYIGAQATFCLLYSFDKKIFNKMSMQKIGFKFMPENFLIGKQMKKQNSEMQGLLPIIQFKYSF